jgi:putative redox protein
MGITARSLTNYQVEITADQFNFIVDEPEGIGDGAGPQPFNMLLSALASCTIITLQMYARRKNWPLEKVELSMNIRSQEVPLPEGGKSRSSLIETELVLHGPLTPEQLKRLEEISTRCPVHRALTGDIEVQSTVRSPASAA